MDQHHVRRAGGLGEVVGGQADLALGRRQAQPAPHGPRQERIDRRALRPDAFFQPCQHQAVGADQAGLDGAQDAQARMGGAADADGLLVDQSVEDVGEGLRRGVGQGLAVLDQGGHQPAQALARAAGPQAVDRDQVLQSLDQGLGCPAGGREAVDIGRGGVIDGGQDAIDQGQGLGRVLQSSPQHVLGAGRGAAQAFAFQRGGGRRFVLAQHQRVLGEGQQADRIERLLDQPGQVQGQDRRAGGGQRRAGRAVGDDAPALQAGHHPAGQGLVGGDEGGGALRVLQRLAQQQGAGARGLFLGAGGDHREAGQALGDRVEVGGLGAQRGDLGQPVGGGLGRAQGLVDDPSPPAAAAVYIGDPGADVGTRDAGAVQQALHRALRMLFALGAFDPVPGAVSQVLVEARQDHGALRGGGDDAQQVGGGRRGAGRAGGDQHLGGRVLAPLLFQGAQQLHPALGNVDQAQGVQSLGPGGQHALQEARRDLPMLGQIAFGQAVQPVGERNLLDLAAVEEVRQGLGQFQRLDRAGLERQLVAVVDHQPRQLEPAAARGDGRQEVEG